MLPQALSHLPSLPHTASTYTCSSYITVFSLVLPCLCTAAPSHFHLTPYHLATVHMFLKIQINHHLCASFKSPSSEFDAPSFGSHKPSYVSLLGHLLHCIVKLHLPRGLLHQTLSPLATGKMPD